MFRARFGAPDRTFVVNELVQEVGPEIEWELDEVVPAMRGSLEEDS